MAWKFADMELSDDDKIDMSSPVLGTPDYPYGLRICLTETELAKLDLPDDPEVGDYIDLRAFATVTSISMNDGPSGRQCRVELQIEKLALESEDDE
jgi:hypothetical protein